VQLRKSFILRNSKASYSSAFLIIDKNDNQKAQSKPKNKLLKKLSECRRQDGELNLKITMVQSNASKFTPMINQPTSLGCWFVHIFIETGWQLDVGGGR